MSDPTPEEDQEAKVQTELLDKAVQNLREHFDTVSIFANNLLPDGGKTRFWYRGSGNWFSRFGHVMDWVTREKERSRVDVQKDESEEM